MKKNLLILISGSMLSLLSINSADATVHIITSGGTGTSNSFLPQTTNAVVGDTITWIWLSGVHTTQSTTIPAGAASWSYMNLTGSNTTFSYLPTVVGTYNYDCHASTPHGMNGVIIVTANTTGIVSTDYNSSVSVFPNPCFGKITIEMPAAKLITFFTISGKKIKSCIIQKGQTKSEIDISELSTGIYFVEIYDGTKIVTKKIVVQ